jgi:hypothetical protein
VRRACRSASSPGRMTDLGGLRAEARAGLRTTPPEPPSLGAGKMETAEPVWVGAAATSVAGGWQGESLTASPVSGVFLSLSKEIGLAAPLAARPARESTRTGDGCVLLGPPLPCAVNEPRAEDRASARPAVASQRLDLRFGGLDSPQFQQENRVTTRAASRRELRHTNALDLRMGARLTESMSHRR